MSSRLMMVLALLLLASAAVAGYWGIAMSRQSSPTEVMASVTAAPELLTPQAVQPASEPREAVVVLAREVAGNTKLSRKDLLVEQLKIAPPGSFGDPEELVGRQVWRTLPAGTILNRASFDSGGPLARMIRTDERAVTIAVDEVMTGGGHLQPGDYIDVLLFLREDNKNNDRTVQMIVPSLRVLSVGANLGLDRYGESLRPQDEEAEQGRQGRTVVLALPEPLVPRFSLAAQVGTLRLTVRSADEDLLASYYDGKPALVENINQQLFAFERLALRSDSRQEGIPVQRGSVVSRDTR